MKKEKPLVVGQKVWVVPQCNEARRNPTPFEATVSKVGNKLFELEGNRKFWCKFELSTMQEKSDYSTNFVVYSSKKEYDEEMLTGKFKGEIVNKINFSEIDLDTLSRVGELLGLRVKFEVLKEQQYKPIEATK